MALKSGEVGFEIGDLSIGSLATVGASKPQLRRADGMSGFRSIGTLASDVLAKIERGDLPLWNEAAETREGAVKLNLTVPIAGREGGSDQPSMLRAEGVERAAIQKDGRGEAPASFRGQNVKQRSEAEWHGITASLHRMRRDMITVPPSFPSSSVVISLSIYRSNMGHIAGSKSAGAL